MKIGRPKLFNVVSDMEKAINNYLYEQEVINKPPSIQGMCIAIGFSSRQSLINYSKRNPEFKPIIDWAKDEIYKRCNNTKRRRQNKKNYKVGKGYVYIIHCTGTKIYKIGISKSDPYNRLHNLQTGCPFGLELVKVSYHDNYHLLERALHAKYHAYNTRGEWFELEDDIFAVVKNDVEEGIIK